MKSFLLRLLAVVHVLSLVVGASAREGDPPGVCSDDDATVQPPDNLVRELLDWLRENGAYVSEKVEIRHLVCDNPLSDRGIFATHDIDVGETVCRIPWNIILKPSEDESGSGTMSDDDSNCGTIDAVADAMSDGGKTPYGTYLLAQPRDYTAAFWSRVSWK